MPYTPVIPSTWSTGRVDLNEALVAILEAFRTAQPTIIRKVWSSAPPNLAGERPFVYVGDITEEVRNDSGLRMTDYTGSVGYVDIMSDNSEAGDRAMVFFDYMRDLFSANARGISTGELTQTGAREEELAQGPLRFYHGVITYRYTLQEGFA